MGATSSLSAREEWGDEGMFYDKAKLDLYAYDSQSVPTDATHCSSGRSSHSRDSPTTTTTYDHHRSYIKGRILPKRSRVNHLQDYSYTSENKSKQELVHDAIKCEVVSRVLCGRSLLCPAPSARSKGEVRGIQKVRKRI